jgi:digeranylgeranylglycerophospholipid reductase
MKIAIIGGGPIGCYAAYLLAKEHHDVSIYENHSQIGAPIQCTGILTSSFDEFNIPVEEFLVNTITKIDVNSPNKSLTVKQKDYVVCRIKFDQYLARMAENGGAKIFVNHSFQRKEGNNLIIKHKQEEISTTPDLVIAADGPLSPTAKAYGFYHKARENYFGIQATVEGNFEPHTIKTYFGESICPGLFAWITPESSTTARVGLAMKKDSRKYFDKFMKQHGFKVKEMQAGTIPVYHPKQKIKHGNCYVVGDASSYVKATTLGGIVPAMKQVEIVVDCIKDGKDVEKELKPVKRKLWTHLKVQKMFDKFSDKDWDTLIHYVNQPKIQKVFERYTRDNPIPLITFALLKEPRFIKFTKHIF